MIIDITKAFLVSGRFGLYSGGFPKRVGTKYQHMDGCLQWYTQICFHKNVSNAIKQDLEINITHNDIKSFL